MQTSWSATVLSGFVLVLAASCAGQPTRRPMEELYREALESSRLVHDPALDAVAEANERARESAKNDDRNSPPPPHGKPEAEGPRVTDVFVDTEIREAIQSIATQAGIVIAVDDLVRGSVTVTLNDVPFETALRMMTLPLGFVYRRCNQEYLVGSPLPTSAMFPQIAETVDYSPKHFTTAELLELTPAYAALYIKASATRNMMVVTAPCPMVHGIITDLERIDQPIPQVLLEAIICVYSPESGFEFGLDLAGAAKSGNGSFVTAQMSDLSLSALADPGSMGGLQAFELTSAYLRALASEGYISIRAAPRVMAQDGERASIVIGEETYFTVGDGQNLFRDLKPVRSGISLSIVPKIRGSEVTVQIERAEVSDELRPSKLLPTADGSLPTLGTRQVSTTVHVRDGETIVIGGLVQRRKVERVVKVPILGDIPGLGLLFQRIDERDEETEVAIFLSPRIVKERPRP